MSKLHINRHLEEQKAPMAKLYQKKKVSKLFSQEKTNANHMGYHLKSNTPAFICFFHTENSKHWRGHGLITQDHMHCHVSACDDLLVPWHSSSATRGPPTRINSPQYHSLQKQENRTHVCSPTGEGMCVCVYIYFFHLLSLVYRI